MLWQEYIPYIFSQSYFGQSLFQWCLISRTNKIPPSWESKSISKIMFSPEYGDLYDISYLCFKPWYSSCICNSHFINPDFHSILNPTLVGNILPHIFPFSKFFLKTIKWWVEIFFKHHLVIVECDHFVKIVLLIREMVVWLIHEVWIVWSWLWYEYGCVLMCVLAQ